MQHSPSSARRGVDKRRRACAAVISKSEHHISDGVNDVDAFVSGNALLNT